MLLHIVKSNGYQLVARANFLQKKKQQLFALFLLSECSGLEFFLLHLC